jgi:uncharacterized protein HemY
MAKSSAVRPVIAPGRVDAALHQEIKAAAAASGRSMAEELAALARQAIEHRKRFPDSAMAQILEMATIGFLLAGADYAKHNGLKEPWQDNLEARRQAALNLCATIITQFVSSDPTQQALTVESLKGRIWTHIVNRPTKPGEGGAS